MNRTNSLVAAGTLLLACGGGAARAPAPPPAALSRIDVEAPGSSCAAGGSAVRTGLDVDADGVLSDAEVTSTSYVCAEPARVLLLRADGEPAGSHCPSGGVAVKAGRDVNADGVLADAEVEKISYQCGADAPSPPRVLTRTEPEPSGVNCPAGGTRIDAGPDRDSNGALDATEVAESQYVCAAGSVLVRTSAGAAASCPSAGTTVSAGADTDADGVLSDAEVATATVVCAPVVFSYTITTQADLDWLVSNVDLVSGSLSLRNGSALTDVSLGGVVVAGDIRVEDNPDLVTLSIVPSALGGNVVVARNPALESLVLWVGPRGDLPLPGSVTVTDAPRLRVLSVDAPAVGGSLTVARTGLAYFAMRALERVGGSFVIADNDALTSCSATRVAYIGGDLVIEDDDAMVVPFDWMTFIGRPNEAHAGDLVVVGSIVVRRNARLAGLYYIPAITARDVRIESNPSLTGVDFFDLVAITGDWTITDNPVLGNFGSASDPLHLVSGSILVAQNPSLVATAGLFPVQTVGGDVTIVGSPKMTYFFMPYLVSVANLRLEDTGVRFLGPDGASGAGDTLVRLEVARSLTLARNPDLAHLDLPRARVLGGLTVQDAPLLPTCEAQALAARLGADATISGTDDAAACP